MCYILTINRRLTDVFLLFTLFQELQHEVSSLLDFKNALLETFPHLQGKLGGGPNPPNTTSAGGHPAYSSPQSSGTLKEDSSGSSNGSSPKNSASNHHHHNHHHELHLESTSSNWASSPMGTLPRGGAHSGSVGGPKKVRKSPDSAGSNIVDSGKIYLALLLQNTFE